MKETWSTSQKYLQVSCISVSYVPFHPDSSLKEFLLNNNMYYPYLFTLETRPLFSSGITGDVMNSQRLALVQIWLYLKALAK